MVTVPDYNVLLASRSGVRLDLGSGEGEDSLKLETTGLNFSKTSMFSVGSHFEPSI